MKNALAAAPPAPAVRWPRVIAVSIAMLLGVAFLASLGLWQLERRVWKLDLIRKVESRAHAVPHAIPAEAAQLPLGHEYEHVQLAGAYLAGRDTWVHASTELGAGYWIISPLRTDSGELVLVNRGFVGMGVAREKVIANSAGPVTGLLRASEAQGSWPRRNDPSQDRWYSRDVAAIAAARGLEGVLPYFIDAEPPAESQASAGSKGRAGGDLGPVRPVAGLTVVHFRNTHLSYAITWFALALMTLVAGIYLVYGEIRCVRS